MDASVSSGRRPKCHHLIGALAIDGTALDLLSWRSARVSPNPVIAEIDGNPFRVGSHGPGCSTPQAGRVPVVIVCAHWFTIEQSEVGPLAQSEKPHRVFLQDERPHLRLDVEALEVGEPAIRRDDRVVGAEQHPLAQQRVRILDEVRWEVFG